MSTLPGNGLSSRCGSGQPSTSLRPRKHSLPVVFRRPSLLGYAAAVEIAREAQVSGVRRRRLSLVTRRLSTTIGWRTAISQDEVVSQAENLCGRFLRNKLRSFGPIHKKLGLQRLRSLSQIGGDPLMVEVGDQLRQLAELLERQNPRLFQSVINSVGLKSLPDESAVVHLFQKVADEIIRSEISWGRIVALYCVAGAIALDCVRLGHPEFVLGLMRGMGSVIEGDGAAWIVQQGGWEALLTCFKNSCRISTTGLLCFLMISVLTTMLLIYFVT
ncbi:bcl-2-related ovarian killer protein homolog B-like [Limulus polyphemus]|uniref:Bcl-2-related ovarian killer protein homolog B-like n=1 Tax=Limulus polyphemus TaxID=6850 RepID=A0ABM1BP45_LIMPO|nr:bcl-2-related ovarian killer protein homolog B-like [Limulus polyphemus]